MLRTIGLNVAMRREIVLQAWLREEANAGRQVVLQAESQSGGELPRGVESSPVAGFIQAIYIIAGVEG